MPYATGRILIPNTLAAGYQRGDFISEDVVRDWDVPAEMVQDEPLTEEATPALAPRPVDDSNRADWVAYVVSRGTDADDAALMSLEELMAAYPEDEEAGRVDDEGAPERPSTSALKSEWVEWAIAAGADEQWARDDSTTKAELQAYEPGTAAPRQQETTDPAADQGNATVGA